MVEPVRRRWTGSQTDTHTDTPKTVSPVGTGGRSANLPYESATCLNTIVTKAHPLPYTNVIVTAV